ncbi:hypothetical protein [Niabella sp.]|uniref:hypothetical protein n=1 Tax=Niabella sp. TaxID=1962976 RepID=UPI002617F2F6|nr:hypothetical protein [Niabella sp.]
MRIFLLTTLLINTVVGLGKAWLKWMAWYMRREVCATPNNGRNRPNLPLQKAMDLRLFLRLRPCLPRMKRELQHQQHNDKHAYDDLLSSSAL